MDARSITAELGGKWQRGVGLSRCPAHDDKTPSLQLKDDPRKSDGLDVHCYAGCDWRYVKAELRAMGLLSGVTMTSSLRHHVIPESRSHKNREPALKLWADAVPLPGTLGEYHLAEHRGLRVSALGDLSHAVRWHGGDINMIVALMSDAVSSSPSGIQRIFVSTNDGRNIKTAEGKNLKKMLGPAGVIRLTPDEDVTLGLGVCEGIEDALTILQSGWAPMWAASSAGSIAKFPVLSGIEALTIFRDDNAAGIKAADECAKRWHTADREVDVVSLKDHL